jgi:hypothetical protein
MGTAHARDSTRPDKARSTKSPSKGFPRRRPAARRGGGGTTPPERERGESPSGPAHPLSVLPVVQEVARRLAGLRSVVLTVSLALQVQRAEYDADIAHTLRQCVSDELDRLVWRLRVVLGHEDGGIPPERQP